LVNTGCAYLICVRGIHVQYNHSATGTTVLTCITSLKEILYLINSFYIQLWRNFRKCFSLYHTYLHHTCQTQNKLQTTSVIHPDISGRNLTVKYFYSKTNQMHYMSNLFYFGTTLYIFRTVCPFCGCLLASSHRIRMTYLFTQGTEFLF